MIKRNEGFIPAHMKLHERTGYLWEWRKQYEQLAVMVGLTKGLGGMAMEIGGMDMEEEVMVKEAYEVVERIDVLDVSLGRFSCWTVCSAFLTPLQDGTEILTAENAHNQRVSRVENHHCATTACAFRVPCQTKPCHMNLPKPMYSQLHFLRSHPPPETLPFANIAVNSCYE